MGELKSDVVVPSITVVVKGSKKAYKLRREGKWIHLVRPTDHPLKAAVVPLKKARTPKGIIMTNVPADKPGLAKVLIRRAVAAFLSNILRTNPKKLEQNVKLTPVATGYHAVVLIDKYQEEKLERKIQKMKDKVRLVSYSYKKFLDKDYLESDPKRVEKDLIDALKRVTIELPFMLEPYAIRLSNYAGPAEARKVLKKLERHLMKIEKKMRRRGDEILAEIARANRKGIKEIRKKLK